MRPEQAVSLLRTTRLFAALDDATLAQLAARAVERTFRKGQMVFFQGDPGDSLFVVVGGLVKVFVTSEDGSEMVLVTLQRPDTFGELALIDGGQRSASAETLDRTTLLAIARRSLMEVVHEHPGLADALLQSLGRVVRRLTEQASDLVFLDLHGRVAKLLLALGDERGREEGGAVALDLHMTQSDLAAMVGGSRQSVNQIMHAFERRGYLEFRGREILLRRPDLLRRRASL